MIQKQRNSFTRFKRFNACLLMVLMVFFSAFFTVGAEELTPSYDVVTTLGFIPSDTVIDPEEPVLYMVDKAGKKLYSFNFESKELRSLQLNLTPERMVYANDKLYITLLITGHQYYTQTPLKGGIAIVNPALWEVVDQFEIDTDPFDLVVDKEGYIYVIPGSNQWENIISYSETTHQRINTSNTIRAWSYAELHPTQNKIITVDTDSHPRDMQWFAISSGTFGESKGSPYHGDYPMATNFRISPDGNYVFNGSGEIFNSELVHFASLGVSFSDIAFDLQSNQFFISDTEGQGIIVYDYGTVDNRVFKPIASLSTSGTVQNLFYREDALITLSKNSTGQTIVEKINFDTPAGPIQITDSFPPSASKELPIITPIVIESDRTLKLSSLSDTITLNDSNGKKADYSLIAYDNYLIIQVEKELQYSTHYTLNIPADALVDFKGQHLARDYTFTFSTDVEFSRMDGTNRYETSVKVSQKGWDTSEIVVLATGEDFPDALTAAPLATKYAAPILLTTSANLHPETAAEIKRLKAQKIYIVGGYGVVSEAIEKKLNDEGIETVRLEGANRYETSLSIAEAIGVQSEVIIATGQNFPDALSIASYSASSQTPILLTHPKSLSTNAAQFIKRNEIKRAYVIGGTGVVSDEVFKKLPNAVRIAGNNRYETNWEVLSNFDFNFGITMFATGTNFPDALSGSALAGLFGAPIVLVSPNMPSDVLDDWIIYNRDLMIMKYILGGNGVVPDSLINKIFN